MACCLTRASHYLVLCWRINNEVLCYLPEDNFTGNVEYTFKLCRKIKNLKLAIYFSWDNELNGNDQHAKHNEVQVQYLTQVSLIRTSVTQFKQLDDVIKWKHFLRYWSFVQGIHRSPVNSPQRPVTQSFDVSLIRARINGWENNRVAGDLIRHGAHYDVTVMNRNNKTC